MNPPVRRVFDSRYPTNPLGSQAYDYCPPVFADPDYSRSPAGLQAACEPARQRRATWLIVTLVGAAALPVAAGSWTHVRARSPR